MGQSEFSIPPYPSPPSSHVIQFRPRLAIIVSRRLLISAHLIISRRNERVDRDFPRVKTRLKSRTGATEREREKKRVRKKEREIGEMKKGLGGKEEQRDRIFRVVVDVILSGRDLWRLNHRYRA